MKESVSFHHPIIYNVLKDLTPVLLSTNKMVHFFFNAQMKFRGETQLDENGIGSLMQRPQFLNIRKTQLSMLYTSKLFLVEQFPILKFLLMMFSTLIIMRHNFLN